MKELNGIIYCWINKESGKTYVGQTTKTLDWRTRMHINSANAGSKMPLHYAIRKYGKDMFEIKTIASATTLDLLNLLEIELIKKYNCLSPNGYNLKLGGENHRQHPETRLKQSKAAKKRFQRDKKKGIHLINLKKAHAACRGKPSWNKGSQASEEARANQSKAHMGQKAWNEGVPMTEEQKERIRLAKAKYSKQIFCPELDKTWLSMESASKETGISAVHIGRLAAKGKVSGSGLTFQVISPILKKQSPNLS